MCFQFLKKATKVVGDNFDVKNIVRNYYYDIQVSKNGKITKLIKKLKNRKFLKIF